LESALLEIFFKLNCVSFENFEIRLNGLNPPDLLQDTILLAWQSSQSFIIFIFVASFIK